TPEAGQFHLGGGFTSSRVGFCRVFQHHNGQTFYVDLWAEAAPCLKDVLFLPGCTRKCGRKAGSMSDEARCVISSCSRCASPTPTIEKSLDSSRPNNSTPPPVRLANAESGSYSRRGVPPRAAFTSTQANSL